MLACLYLEPHFLAWSSSLFLLDELFTQSGVLSHPFASFPSSFALISLFVSFHFFLLFLALFDSVIFLFVPFARMSWLRHINLVFLLISSLHSHEIRFACAWPPLTTESIQVEREPRRETVAELSTAWPWAKKKERQEENTGDGTMVTGRRRARLEPRHIRLCLLGLDHMVHSLHLASCHPCVSFLCFSFLFGSAECAALLLPRFSLLCPPAYVSLLAFVCLLYLRVGWESVCDSFGWPTECSALASHPQSKRTYLSLWVSRWGYWRAKMSVITICRNIRVPDDFSFSIDCFLCLYLCVCGSVFLLSASLVECGTSQESNFGLWCSLYLGKNGCSISSLFTTRSNAVHGHNT